MLAEDKALLVSGLEGELGRSESAEGCAAAPEVGLRAGEASLVARLKAGELGAFEELVAEYQPLVQALALRILGDAEDARDATQETFIKVYRHLSRFRGEASFKTWVCRIAINQARSDERWFRRRRRNETGSLDEPEEDQRRAARGALTSPAATPEAATLARERQRQLEQALAGLKKDFRIAVMLRDVEGLSYEEIAYILEISVGTVKSRIARGREMLRARLEQAAASHFDGCPDD
ncbi:MAG TPA: sigma-70 family RNA polymerase sigma factor [Blastocatellia bacterium]|jgi:RNA polymerase sigma-70 factor (ECF subfamily)|nr:sigma-70 family RNA polymerase sigma factor [Blastocatellia bacterium]